MVSEPIQIPSTMKACVATGFGAIDENITLQAAFPTPELPQEGHVLMKVLACALAPGDVRVLSGKTKMIQLPKGPPYVPGSDTSGHVVAVHDETETKFKVGDYLVARFDEPRPQGGLAAYRLVKTNLCEKCPDSIPPIVSCGLTASTMAAKTVIRNYVKAGDRLLVIGGSGAVGSSALQYARLAGASHIATVSTQTELCTKLGAHKVIDYREQKWWEMKEYQENKFDVVLDLVNGDNWTTGGCSGKAIDPKGVYIALLAGVETEMEVRGAFDIAKLVLELIGRKLYSQWNPSIPTYATPEALKLEDGSLKSMLEDVVSGKLAPQLDPASPFPFTEEGLRKAFHLQKSRHAHGKVMVNLMDDQ